MRIKRIKIENFRSIERIEMSNIPAGVALFGKNGEGKSSIIGAIQFALLGFNRWTDRAGRGAERGIRDGAKSAEIEIDLQDATLAPIRVQASINRKGTSNEFAVFAPDTGEIFEEIADRDALWRFLGVRKEHAIAAMMPDAFLASKEASDVLASVAADALTLDAVRGHVKDRWAIVEAFAAKRKIQISKPIDLDVIGGAAFDRRREAKRDLRDVEAKIAEVGFVRQPVAINGEKLTMADMPALKTDLTTLEEHLAGLNRKLGRADVLDAAAVESKRAQLLEDLEGVAGEEEAVAERVKAVEEDAAKAEYWRDDARQRNANEGEKSRILATAHADAVKAQKSLLGKGTKCPTCQQLVTAEIAEALRKPIDALVAETAAKVDAAKEQSNNSLRELAESHEAVKQARDAERAAKAELDRAKQRRARIEAEIEALPNPDPNPVDVEAVEAEIETARDGIDRVSAMVVEVDRWADAEAAKGHLGRLTDEIASLDWIVKAFKDGEVPKALTADALESWLIPEANRACLRFGGYGIEVAASGKRMDILLTAPKHGTRPIEDCSDGQKAIAAWAVATAFSDSGAPIILDDTNNLDAWLRRELLRSVVAGDQGTTRIVAGATQQSKQDWQRVAAALAPMAVYLVEDGAAIDAAQVTVAA